MNSPVFRESRTPPRQILLVCTQRIGDVLLATPLARSLKRAWPAAELDMLVLRGTEGVLEGNPDISKIIALPQRTGFGEKLDQIRHLWRRYDLAVSPLATDRARLYCWLAGRWQVGLLQPLAKDRSKALLLDQWTYFDDLDTHTVSMGLRLTQLLDIPACFEVVPPCVYSEQVMGLLAGKRFAVLHPYPKFNYKMWTRDGWIALARWLQDRGLEVVLTGGPDADECTYVEKIALSFPSGLTNLAGKLSLGETAELIRRAQLYVGPDTAVTHIAAATGTPTVALFGPSNPVKWGPWPSSWTRYESPWPRCGSGRQGNVFLLQGAGDCVPCMLEGCERNVSSRSECLLHLEAGKVIQAAESMLRVE